MLRNLLLSAAAACLVAGSAGAQSFPRLPGGLGGLPDVTKMGLPNVAGVLGYCLKNSLLSGSNAGTLVDALGNKPGVKSSPDYASGMAGNILAGNGSPVSLGSLPSSLKSQACSMVMEHGVHLL